MTTVVTVSPKFQIVIPQDIRKAFGIKAGQKLMFLQYDGNIVLVPVRPLEEARGAFPGLDTAVEREPDRL